MYSIAHRRRGRVRLSDPLNTDPRTRFAGITTEELSTATDHWKTERALILAKGSDLSAIDRSTLAVLDCDLEDGIAELNQRTHASTRLQAAGDPLAPRLSKGNPALIDLSQRLKASWPIDRFCETLMGMELDRGGTNPKAQCPLGTHRDTTPSFTLYVHEGRFHCYGCGESGDIWDIAQTVQRIGFADAVRMLADATLGPATSGVQQ